MADLPIGARRLLIGTAVGAATLAAIAVSLPTTGVRPALAVALAVGIVVGELVRIDLPQRGGGTASFGLGDAALTAGLLLLGPAEVVIGAVLGVVLLQLHERVALVKFATNLVQYTAGAAVAAIARQILVPGGGEAVLAGDGEIGPAAAAAVTVGMALFLAVNALTVGGMIALTSGRGVRSTVLALLPAGSLVAVGDVALGLIAVLMWQNHTWALPALAVPWALLWHVSRQAVHAQVERERSAAIVSVEHDLSAAATSEEVVAVLAEGVRRVLGGQGVVWRDDGWATPVPAGSGPCGIDASPGTAEQRKATAFGLADTRSCLAVGLGDGVLIALPDELALDDDGVEWLTRLGGSGRVHLARVAARQALESERATLAAVVDGTGDGVLLADTDGTVAVWNPAIARLSGIPAAVAVGRPVADLLGPGPWLVDGVHEVVRPDSDDVWRVAVAGIEEHDARAPGRACVVAVHDITADRRTAQAREDMLAVVSHELKTPLTGITASAQMLHRRHDRLSPEQRQRLVAQILDRGHHLTRLVEDLLLVGQLTTRRGHIEPRFSPGPVAVDQVLVDAVEAMRVARPDHRWVVDVEGPCATRTDPLRLRQILDNLLDNAGKYSASGSTVTVRGRSEGGEDGHVVLEVADEGRGIPPGDLDRIFEQFVRVEDPLTMTTSGAGLGLYIVRQLTDALGGELDLQSTVGVGTTVVLRLPFRMADVEVTTTS